MDHKSVFARLLLANPECFDQSCGAFGMETQRRVDDDVMLASHFNRTLGVVQVCVEFGFDAVAVGGLKLFYALFTTHKTGDCCIF